MTDQKEKALGLSWRNKVKWVIVSLLEFQYLLNLLHSYSMCLLVLIEYMPYEHEKSFLRKNLSLYLPVGAWLIMALVALVHNKFDRPKYYNQELFLTFKSSIRFRLSSNKSRKFFPLESAAWKDILHYNMAESLSLLLQKFQEDLQGKEGTELKLLEYLSTKVYNDYFCLLGQSQNSMWLLESLEKKFLSSWEITTEWIWCGWDEESKILLAVWRESIMMTIWLMLVMLTTWLIPHQITNNSALVVVILTTLWIVLMTELLCEWICEMDIVIWFLILVSETIIKEDIFKDALNIVLSNFFMCFLIFEEHRWKENLLENESIRWFPSLNSSLKNEKEGISSLCLLSASIRVDFRQSLCLGVRRSIEML